jgi:N-acetylneuraminic acid mutarotase
LEVTFESQATPSSSSQGSLTSSSQGSYSNYNNFQAPVVPVNVQNYGAPSAESKWLTVLETNPFSFGHTGTNINEHLLVFGGYADEDTTNHCLLQSDTHGGKFSKLKVRGDIPPPRERHSASLIGKKLYVFGGYCRSGEVYYNTLYVFESETLTWTSLEPHGNLPEKRCGHSASVVDGKIWIFGGRVKVKKSTFFDSEGSGVQYRNDVHCYDPVTNEWYRYEPRGIGPSGRALHSAVVAGRKIYIFGGANSSGSRNDSSGFCDLYELDIDTMCWTECETQGTPPSPCYGHSGSYIGNDRILFFGGKGYKVLNQINVLDIKTMTWLHYAYAGNTLTTRWGHSATIHDNRILIYGGRSDEGYYNSIDTIDYTTQLIELKPEEQAKENTKRKQEEKNRTREVIGNLQTQISSLQAVVQQMGDQFISQRKTLTETRNTLLAIKQENDRLKRTLAEAKAKRSVGITSF